MISKKRLVMKEKKFRIKSNFETDKCYYKLSNHESHEGCS